MTDELKEEWNSIIGRADLYIYGAAKTAERLYDFISYMDCKENVKGFLVTDGGNNVCELCGLPVRDIHDFRQKNAIILVPHMGVYRKQISEVLDSSGFKNIFFVSTLMDKTAKEESEKLELDFTKVGWEIYERKSESEKKQDACIRERVLSILQEGHPDFGYVKPYQSMEMIGIRGARPTEYRIREYGLRKILKPVDDVLDIGCNTGFLDMSIASLVHSVTGIEYDESLVKVANLVMKYLKLKNCIFYNSDFNDWCMDAAAKYNVIFSFAIHHWLDIEPGVYAMIIDKLLRVYGYVCFESHSYGTDLKFNKSCMEFEKLGYHRIFEKKINDDGMQERKYVLFQKMNG